MTGPKRRDRSPKGTVPKPKLPKKSQPKEIQLYTPVVRLENPRNDVQEARLLSRKLVMDLAPTEAVGFTSFPCGNRFCESCESDHKIRLEILGETNEQAEV